MFEINDRVVCHSYKAKVPFNMVGSVQKVYKNYVLVKWEKEGRFRRDRVWFRGNFIYVKDLSDQSRIARWNVVLIERRGGPW